MSTPPYDIVIYHANCIDGMTSAWVARMHSPNAEFIPADYGDDPPTVEGKRVLVVDFTYPRETLIAMSCVAEHLMVLDHHKEAVERLRDLPYYDYCATSSGAGMAWDHLFMGHNSPSLVDYVEDHDLWRFDLDHSREHHAYMTTLPLTFEAWDEANHLHFSKRIELGRVVEAYRQRVADGIASRAQTYVIDGQGFWVCNCPSEFRSIVGEVLYNREPSLPAICWTWSGTEDGIYRCSCRSRKGGFDVGAFATSRGGGGHENAARFNSHVPPMTLGKMIQL